MNNDKKMSKKQFWSRIVLYILFGAILPFVFLIFRFHLFSKVSTLSIGGWGIVGIIFVSVFFMKLIKAVKKGLPFSLGSQILEGVCKTILPLIIAALCVFFMKDFTTEIFQFLCVLIVCEMVAIVSNPLPQWAHENKIEEQEGNTKKLLETLGIFKKEEKK